MNLRIKNESESEKQLRLIIDKWSNAVDEKWDYKLNVIYSVEYLLNTIHCCCRFGFLTGQRKICTAGPDSSRECIIIKCDGCDYLLIIQDWEFVYYEGLAKSLRQCSAKAQPVVKIR